jgi:hypothetical protein
MLRVAIHILPAAPSPCCSCAAVGMLQVNKTLPYRSADKPVNTAAKDVLAPNACVAGQLGPTAEPAACDVTGAAAAMGALALDQQVCRHWEYLGTCMLTKAVLLGSRTTMTQ